MMNDCNTKREETISESIINELESAIADARDIANSYGDLINRIDTVQLECDMPVKSSVCPDPSEQIDTIFYKLRSLSSRLQNANRKNSEILDKLNKML